MDKERRDELLKESAELMLSPDYRKRLLAEIYQVFVRSKSLEKMLSDWENGTLGFTSVTPKEVFYHQLYLMKLYAQDLFIRAKIDGLVLPDDLKY